MHKNAHVLASKEADSFYIIAKLIEQNKPVDVLIYDLPRAQIERINYAAIEKVKDGFFASGKYESTECTYESPHVIIFANTPPDTSQMSQDRWTIKDITNDANTLIQNTNNAFLNANNLSGY